MIEHVPTPRVFQRRDVVIRHGQVTLLNDDLTPQQAMVEDLLFIRQALDAAGIRYLLVRGARDEPVIAVDTADRQRLDEALTVACQNEPFYARRVRMRKDGTPKSDADQAAILVADGGISVKGRLFRLYRPRVDRYGRLEFGTECGVQLELWQYTEEHIITPQANVLMRQLTPRAEAVPDEVERYGVRWPTLAGMFDEHADDINFDIDMVFSWVDGSALEWQRARARRMEAYVIGEGDGSEARFRQLDELKYALRSVHLFAPWVRNIYIVTDSGRPEWLDEHPRVQVLPSERFFRNLSDLPTHNSHAVESQLHNIPGLSEHFIYSNDDMFFGRNVRPDMFFSPGGVSKFIEATLRIGTGDSDVKRSGFENAARVNRRLLKDRFGKTITRHLEHAATPLRVSVMRELEAEFPEDFARTSASAFRQASDISVTNSLYHYYALITGRAVQQTQARVKYVDTTMRSGLTDMRKLLARRNVDFFCLNDGSFPELTAEERASAVRSFLDDYFPIAAPWERIAAVEVEQAL